MPAVAEKAPCNAASSSASPTVYSTVAPVPAAATMSSRALTSVASVRPMIMTAAPSRASQAAEAPPMPPPPPVISADIPASGLSVCPVMSSPLLRSSCLPQHRTVNGAELVLVSVLVRLLRSRSRRRRPDVALVQPKPRRGGRRADGGKRNWRTVVPRKPNGRCSVSGITRGLRCNVHHANTSWNGWDGGAEWPGTSRQNQNSRRISSGCGRSSTAS